MRKLHIDSANKSTQIVVKDNCAGISLYPKTALNGASWEEFRDTATVRVELVRKSQPNAVLYTMSLSDLYDIWKGFFKTPKGIVIPFAFKDNLLLNKDSYLQIDITWTGQFTFTDLTVQNNTLATNTNVPISFKKIELDGELEVDTEHFEYVFIPDSIIKIETFVDTKPNELTNKSVSDAQLSNYTGSKASSMSKDSFQNAPTQNKPVVNTGQCGCTGEVKRQKIEMDFNYMSYFSAMPTETNVLFKTEANQKIKFFGDGLITLMQA